jgi:anti-anti-sigma factor
MDLRLITSDAEHDATPAVVVQEERTRVVVRLVGEIDLAARPALDAAVELAAGSTCTDIVVDLGETRFIDCSVLAALGRLQEAAGARGGRVRIVGARRSVASVIELGGMTPLLSLDEDVPQPR